MNIMRKLFGTTPEERLNRLTAELNALGNQDGDTITSQFYAANNITPGSKLTTQQTRQLYGQIAASHQDLA